MPRALTGHRTLQGLIIALALAAGAMPAAAQAGHWSGDWQQIASNAGRCPSCRIAVAGDGRTLTVTANNGWLAQLAAGKDGGLTVASGEGRWAGRLADAPFHIRIVERGMRLYMTMEVFTPGRPKSPIRAVFGRSWVGA
ncbi:MAG TPA: hypothetical protein VNZ94_07550 [Xanthobacteraceae bacterium]|nr:hypothetical protein [Xanthobacteraceae bacterium]